MTSIDDVRAAMRAWTPHTLDDRLAAARLRHDLLARIDALVVVADREDLDGAVDGLVDGVRRILRDSPTGTDLAVFAQWLVINRMQTLPHTAPGAVAEHLQARAVIIDHLTSRLHEAVRVIADVVDP